MEAYPVQVHVRVRGSDLGPDELVHEASLLSYFHEARRAYLSVLNAQEQDFRYRVIEASLRVLQGAEAGDELAVRARVSEMAGSTLCMVYLVRDRLNGHEVCRGATTLMLVDQAGRDLFIPVTLRDRVQALEGRPFLLPA